MTTRIMQLALSCAAATTMLSAQTSPPAQANLAVTGKNLSIKYSAPSVRGRKIFGPGGLLSRDPTYPIWRAGANSATAFHTDANLAIGPVNVPKGDYTFYVGVKDPEAWELIISKETGQWGLDYHPDLDLGRVKMTMGKPSAPIERLKYSLINESANSVKLQLEWENHVATVPVTVK